MSALSRFGHTPPHSDSNHLRIIHDLSCISPKQITRLYLIIFGGSRVVSKSGSKCIVVCTTLSAAFVLRIEARMPCRPKLCKPSISLTIETRPGSSDRRRTFQLRVRSLFSSFFLAAEKMQHAWMSMDGVLLLGLAQLDQANASSDAAT
jgi:hypothetical protein